MTNAEKYASAEERAKAFRKFCNQHRVIDHGNIVCHLKCKFCKLAWLDQEAEEEDEKILPCPSCGNKSVFIVNDKSSPMPWSVKCSCGYSSGRTPDKELTIATHNRVARAVISTRENELK